MRIEGLPEINYGYNLEEDARAVAEWLSDLCSAQVGGNWHPRWHKNRHWYPVACLGQPYIATVSVLKNNGGLRFTGGFVSEAGRGGWRPGDSAHGNSPLEVMLVSYQAIAKRHAEEAQRLAQAQAETPLLEILAN